MTDWEFDGTCGVCGRDYTRPLTKYEAAFFDSLDLDMSCPHCGGAPSGSGHGIPEIDLDLLETWWREDGLVFLSQDEDLIMADTKLTILRDFIGDDRDKAEAMAPVLAVKFYSDFFDDDAEREWTARWLVTNRKAVSKFTETYILKELDRRLGDRLAGQA
ncbi:MAG: hypothetical protein AAGF30_14125 [Pseudomonadota bacterium]